jgi:hypothetical protein
MAEAWAIAHGGGDGRSAKAGGHHRQHHQQKPAGAAGPAGALLGCGGRALRLAGGLRLFVHLDLLGLLSARGLAPTFAI